MEDGSEDDMAVDEPTPPAAAQEQAPQQPPPPPIPLKDTIFRFQLYGPSLRSSHTRTVQIRLSVSCVFYP